MQKAIVSILLIMAFSVLIILSPVKASGDYWITRAPIPVAFDVEGAAAANGQIYVIGQAGGKSLSYAYDPSFDSWSPKQPMPTYRTSFGLVACGNLIYAIGGVTGYNANGLAASTGTNEVYDPATNTWTTKASMPTNRSEVEAASVNGKIYVIGGRTEGAQSTVNITEIYDPITDSWTSGASMPYPVVLAASAVVDNRICVIGGQDEFLGSKQNPVSPNVQFNQIYNAASNSWSIGQSIPQGGWQATGSATTGENASKKVYVIGGLDANSDGLVTANEIYDPATDNWKLGTAFPTTHDYVTNTLAAVNLNDSIYVFGGIAQANEGFYEITEQYIPTDYNGTIIQAIHSAGQQTLTPTISAAPILPTNTSTPSPNVPEFPAIIIVPLLICVLSVAALLSHRRTNLEAA